MQDDSDKQVPLWKVFFGGEKSKTTSTDTKTKTTTTKTTTTSTTTSTTKSTTSTEKPPKPGSGKDESGAGGGSINKVSPLQESPDEGTINSGSHQDTVITQQQDSSMRWGMSYPDTLNCWQKLVS